MLVVGLIGPRVLFVDDDGGSRSYNTYDNNGPDDVECERRQQLQCRSTELGSELGHSTSDLLAGLLGSLASSIGHLLTGLLSHSDSLILGCPVVDAELLLDVVLPVALGRVYALASEVLCILGGLGIRLLQILGALVL